MSSLIVPVVEIESLTKHPNADTLEIARFKGFGWQSIVKIGEFKVGDWVVFVPPDCLLPDVIIQDQKVEYLKGRRTRTVKLRKELSEGMVMPLDVINRISGTRQMFDLGENVAELLHIEKYEPPEPEYQVVGPKSKKNRPYNSKDFPTYTDIQHYKNFTGAIAEGEIVFVTEKIHGTNFRAGWVKKTKLSLWDRVLKLFGKYDEWAYTCGSRQVEMPLSVRQRTSWYNKVLKYNLYQKMGRMVRDMIPKGYIVYGEIFGPKIQDLTYGVASPDLVIFDVMDSETKTYLNVGALVAFTDNHFPGALVPIIYIGPFDPVEIEKLSNGPSLLAQKFVLKQIREGVVVKPIRERVDPVLGRVILKFVGTEYLTRKGGTEYK